VSGDEWRKKKQKREVKILDGNKEEGRRDYTCHRGRALANDT
jgi:hypothetical protein